VTQPAVADCQDAVRWVKHDGHRIRVFEKPGVGPPIILLHGFPDNLHLYDSVVPLLGDRRVIRFDFLGWGGSDKPRAYPRSAHDQTGELADVIASAGSDKVVIVAHDASGPPAIDWALEHPGRVELLVLLNTYYGWSPTLRPPPAIALFSLPFVRVPAQWLGRNIPSFKKRIYYWQLKRFIRDDTVRQDAIDGLYADFPAALESFFSLNNDLWRTIISRTGRWRDVEKYAGRVRVVFGREDPYLNRHVARNFARRFPRSELTLLKGAGHFVQIDDPEGVAEHILA
jgi:pimeloyl-ACP methyl ester carboxylesterase